MKIFSRCGKVNQYLNAIHVPNAVCLSRKFPGILHWKIWNYPPQLNPVLYFTPTVEKKQRPILTFRVEVKSILVQRDLPSLITVKFKLERKTMT